MLHELPRLARRTRKRLRKRLAHHTGPVRKALRVRQREREIARQIERSRATGTSSGPDFLIIGAPKCATSWLLHALCQHPRIVMVQEEVEYFTKRLHQPLDWYSGLFDEGSAALNPLNAAYRRPFEECRVGEKSASYCALSPRRIGLVRALRPDVRLILLIRDPVKRHWAHTKRYFSKQYFGKKGLDLSMIDEAAVLAFFEKTRRFGEYSRMIENWQRHFDRSQLLILVQEEIFQDPDAAYAAALAHLGLAADAGGGLDLAPTLQGRRNRGPDVALPDHLRRHLEDMFRPEYARIERILGRSLSRVWTTPA